MCSYIYIYTRTLLTFHNFDTKTQQTKNRASPCRHPASCVVHGLLAPGWRETHFLFAHPPWNAAELVFQK